MKRRFYLLDNEYYCWKWLVNFAAKLPEVAEALGISTETVAAIVARSLTFNYVMLAIEVLRDNLELWVKAKDGLLEGTDVEPESLVSIPKNPDMPTPRPTSVDPKVFDLPIAVADAIINNINATPEILQLLKLVPPSQSGIEIPEDRRRPSKPASNRPKVTVTASGTNITGEITRGRNLKGTNAWVYSNRTTGNSYTFLTSTIGSNFADQVVSEEGVDRITISYMVQLMDKNNQLIGQPSEPFTITVVRPLGA